MLYYNVIDFEHDESSLFIFFIDIYNKFKDKDRSSLTGPTLFNYMYININMGPLEAFDPSAAAHFWLERKNRKPQTGRKSKEQDWFYGVFKEAEDKEKKAKTNNIKF